MALAIDMFRQYGLHQNKLYWSKHVNWFNLHFLNFVLLGFFVFIDKERMGQKGRERGKDTQKITLPVGIKPGAMCWSVMMCHREVTRTHIVYLRRFNFYYCLVSESPVSAFLCCIMHSAFPRVHNSLSFAFPWIQRAPNSLSTTSQKKADYCLCFTD